MSALLLALIPMINNLTPTLIQVISHIKAQTGQTTDEIIANAGIVLDANDKKLLEDLVRLGVL